MPMYCFKCKKCEEIFEEIVSLKDIEETEGKIDCPLCKKKLSAERQIVNPKHFKHISWSTWRVTEDARKV